MVGEVWLFDIHPWPQEVMAWLAHISAMRSQRAEAGARSHAPFSVHPALCWRGGSPKVPQAPPTVRLLKTDTGPVEDLYRREPTEGSPICPCCFIV